MRKGSNPVALIGISMFIILANMAVYLYIEGMSTTGLVSSRSGRHLVTFDWQVVAFFAILCGLIGFGSLIKERKKK